LITVKQKTKNQVAQEDPKLANAPKEKVHLRRNLKKNKERNELWRKTPQKKKNFKIGRKLGKSTRPAVTKVRFKMKKKGQTAHKKTKRVPYKKAEMHTGGFFMTKVKRKCRCWGENRYSQGKSCRGGGSRNAKRSPIVVLGKERKRQSYFTKV